MTIWILFALMTGAAVMAVLWPLSRAGRPPPEAGAEAQFYRDQIAEIERDLARGLLSPAEAEGARIEAGRRLLRATGGAGERAELVGEPALRRRRGASALALSTVPLLALTVYGAYGRPGAPSQPLASRPAPTPVAAGGDLGQMVARVEAHLQERPDDARGWEVIAPVYMRQGRFAEAARAWGYAIRHGAESPVLLANLGEALASAEGGVISAEARAAFERALALDAEQHKARFYLARAAEQDGDATAARARYGEILARSPADAPWVPLVRERLAALGGEVPGGAAGAGIAALPEGERRAAVAGMVEGLAARLKAQGGSADEWGRLVRSYAVLGERAKAVSALNDARSALRESATGRESLDALSAQLGLQDGAPQEGEPKP